MDRGYLASLSGFLHHFLRKDYGTFQLFSGGSGQQTAGLLERTAAYLKDVLEVQGLGVVLPLAAVCVCSLLVPLYKSLSQTGGQVAQKAKGKGRATAKKVGKILRAQDDVGVGSSSSSRADATALPLDALIDLAEGQHVTLVLLGTLLFYFLVFHSLSNLPLDNPLLYGVHQRFWMQPSVILFALSGLGFNMVAVKMSAVLEKIAPSSSSYAPSLLLLLSVLLCCGQAQKWFNHSDQSGAFYFRDYARALVSPLPPSSILIINYDMQW